MMRIAPLLCAVILLLLAAAPASASGTEARIRDLGAFPALPVLHEGRVKPLDSFARIELRRLSGRETPPGGGAPAAWLAGILFDPARAMGQHLFAVRDAGVRRQLGLPEDGARARYSLADLAPGLAATEKLLPALMARPEVLTPAQKELLSLHDRAIGFSQLLEALGMILPLEGVESLSAPDDAPRRFAEGPTWLELRRAGAEDAAARLKAIVARKGEDIDRYTPEELALAQAGMKLEALRRGGQVNTLFRIMPPQWAGQAEWLSPWMALETGQGSPAAAAYLSLWQDMARAWRAGDGRAWRQAASAAAEAAREQARRGDGSFSPARLSAERFYNILRPFRVAEICYVLALLLLVAAGGGGAGRFAHRMGVAALALAAGGMALQACGLAARVFILSRPPVGTLYETLLFVSLVVLLGAWAAARGRAGPVLRAGLLVALGLLLAAPAVAPHGDSLEMLVAVLNTNFWLATHVIVITAGYGVSILAAILAHMILFRRAFPRAAGDGQGPRAGMVQAALAASLFLTAFGTALGGIWADQSWGRFWGWDPKENGALLIVLWIAWILHGRMGGQLRDVAYLAAVAGLNIIVALSWFGVNLLNIGLHSYGFTSGAAVGFTVFCAGQSVLIAVLAARAGRGRRHEA